MGGVGGNEEGNGLNAHPCEQSRSCGSGKFDFFWRGRGRIVVIKAPRLFFDLYSAALGFAAL